MEHAFDWSGRDSLFIHDSKAQPRLSSIARMLDRFAIPAHRSRDRNASRSAVHRQLISSRASRERNYAFSAGLG